MKNLTKSKVLFFILLLMFSYVAGATYNPPETYEDDVVGNDPTSTWYTFSENNNFGMVSDVIWTQTHHIESSTSGTYNGEYLFNDSNYQWINFDVIMNETTNSNLTRFWIENGTSEVQIAGLRFSNPNWECNDGAWQILTEWHEDEWYDVNLTFNWTTHRYQVTLNSTSYGWYNFMNNENWFDNFEIAESSASKDFNIYLDNLTVKEGYQISTNTATSVENTSATLNGYIQFSAEPLTCGFWINTDETNSTSYIFNETCAGTYDTGDTFTTTVSGLVVGDYYHARAWVNNGDGFVNDTTEIYFITEPDPPTNFNASGYDGSGVNIKWDNATVNVSNFTSAIRFSTDGYPGWDAGTLIQNTTTNTTTFTGVESGKTFYFSVFHYINASASPLLWVYGDPLYGSWAAPTYPENLSIVWFNDTEIRMSWDRANDTVIVRNETNYPPTPSHGTQVYNGSLEFYADSGLTPSTRYYYRCWDWNGAEFSSVANSSNDTFTRPMQPQNILATTTVNATNIDINVSWNNDSSATQCVARRGNSSYPTDEYSGLLLYNGSSRNFTVETVAEPYYYRLFAYNSTTNLYSFGANATLYIIVANCYEENTSDALGGWTIFFTNEDGSVTFENATCYNPTLINVSDVPTGENIEVTFSNISFYDRMYVLDIEVDGVYFINGYLTPTNDSDLYRIDVIDELSNGIADVYIVLSHYVNGSYENVSSGYTDGAGQYYVFLQPFQTYKAVLEGEGYVTVIYTFTTNPIVYVHTMMMYFEDIVVEEDVYFWDMITFEGFINSTDYLWVNFSDIMNETSDYQLWIWCYNHSSHATYLYANASDVNSYEFSYNVSVNTSNTYIVTLSLNHTTFGGQEHSLLFEGTFTPLTTATSVDDLLQANFFYNPFGWSNSIVFFLMLVVLFEGDKKYSGIYLAICGFLLLFINIYIGINLTVPGFANGVIPILMIATGFISQRNIMRSTEGAV